MAAQPALCSPDFPGRGDSCSAGGRRSRNSRFLELFLAFPQNKWWSWVGWGVGWLRPMQMACPPFLPPSPFSSGHAAASGVVGTPFPASEGRRRGWPKSTLPLFMPRTHLVGGLDLFSCPFKAPNNGLPPPLRQACQVAENPGPGRGGWEAGRAGTGPAALFPGSRTPGEPRPGTAERRGGCLGPGSWQRGWAAQGQWQSRGGGPVGIHHPLQGPTAPAPAASPVPAIGPD